MASRQPAAARDDELHRARDQRERFGDQSLVAPRLLGDERVETLVCERLGGALERGDE